MRIIVITDTHANLPALEAALAAARAEGYDAIFHTGDVIAIGPHPAECLELLLNTPNAHFVRGNHEVYLVDGLPSPQPAWLSDGEVQHQQWTHARLGPQQRAAVAEWPYVLELDLEGVKTAFLHYALDASGRDFQPVARDAAAADLDRLFAAHDARLIFYGHHHPQADVTGWARYVNPGSLGCHDRAVARYCLAEFSHGQYRLEHRSVPYDDAELFKALEQRAVPERDFIRRVFFRRRP